MFRIYRASNQHVYKTYCLLHLNMNKLIDSIKVIVSYFFFEIVMRDEIEQKEDKNFW